jgi:hypothetical protein
MRGDKGCRPAAGGTGLADNRPCQRSRYDKVEVGVTWCAAQPALLLPQLFGAPSSRLHRHTAATTAAVALRSCDPKPASGRRPC